MCVLVFVLLPRESFLCHQIAYFCNYSCIFCHYTREYGQNNNAHTAVVSVSTEFSSSSSFSIFPRATDTFFGLSTQFAVWWVEYVRMSYSLSPKRFVYHSQLPIDYYRSSAWRLCDMDIVSLLSLSLSFWHEMRRDKRKWDYTESRIWNK